MRGVLLHLRRWLRYRHAASMAAQELIYRGHWLTTRRAEDIRERERRFAGIYPRRPATRGIPQRGQAAATGPRQSQDSPEPGPPVTTEPGHGGGTS